MAERLAFRNLTKKILLKFLTTKSLIEFFFFRNNMTLKAEMQWASQERVPRQQFHRKSDDGEQSCHEKFDAETPDGKAISQQKLWQWKIRV